MPLARHTPRSSSASEVRAFACPWWRRGRLGTCNVFWKFIPTELRNHFDEARDCLGKTPGRTRISNIRPTFITKATDPEKGNQRVLTSSLPSPRERVPRPTQDPLVRQGPTILWIQSQASPTDWDFIGAHWIGWSVCVPNAHSSLLWLLLHQVQLRLLHLLLGGPDQQLRVADRDQFEPTLRE